MVDILQRDRVVEIQTANFRAIRRKLEKLLESNEVCLVHPIAKERWITKPPAGGAGRARSRRSPKHGSFCSVFDELVSIPRMLSHPNFSLEMVLIEEEQLRYFDGTRAWRRRGWVTQERRLISVLDHRLLRSPEDLAGLIPAALGDEFTTVDLADSINQPRRLAQRMVYCLRAAGCIEPVSKRANLIVYSRTVA